MYVCITLIDPIVSFWWLQLYPFTYVRVYIRRYICRCRWNLYMYLCILKLFDLSSSYRLIKYLQSKTARRICKAFHWNLRRTSASPILSRFVLRICRYYTVGIFVWCIVMVKWLKVNVWLRLGQTSWHFRGMLSC